MSTKQQLLSEYLDCSKERSASGYYSFTRFTDIRDNGGKQVFYLSTTVTYPKIESYARTAGIEILPELRYIALRESFWDLADSACCAKHIAEVSAIIPGHEVESRLIYLERELVENNVDKCDYIKLLSMYSLGIGPELSEIFADICEGPRGNLYISRLTSLIKEGRLNISSPNAEEQYILSNSLLYVPENVEILKRVVELGARANYFAWPYASPILQAAEFENEEGLKLLLDNGGKDIINIAGYPAYWDAHQIHTTAMLESDEKFANLSTPLATAATSGNISIAMLLLEYGADVNAGPSEGQSSLEKAAMFGRFDAAKLLLNAGAIQVTAALETTPERFPHIKKLLQEKIDLLSGV
ncbi:Ankyrin-1 [Dactylellina cionopaga]|nr:Ankyrin-1 [Dactylellina cionopaga]